MLIRVLLTLEPAPLRRRFQRLLSDGDVSIVRSSQRSGRSGPPFPGADFDLLIASRSRLREPATETVRSARDLPEPCLKR